MKFKDMSLKEKLGWLWDYYRGPAFFTILAVLTICSLIYTMFIQKHPDNYCGVAVFNQFMSIEDTQLLQSDLNNAIDTGENERINIHNFYNDSTDVLDQADLNQKFNTYIFTSQLQLLISDEEATKSFAEVEYTVPLNEILSNEQLQKYVLQDRVLYAKNPATGNDEPFAIDITSSALINRYKLFEGKQVFASFVPMPEETNEKTLKVLAEFLK